MKKILIIQLARLGDVMQTLPLLHSLKKSYPECDLTFLGIKSFTKLIESDSLLEKLIFFPPEKEHLLFIKDIIPFKNEILDIIHDLNFFENYDLLINLTNTQLASFISKKLKASEKTGKIESDYLKEIKVAGDFPKYLFSLSRLRKNNLFNLADIFQGYANIPPKRITDIMSVAPGINDRARNLLFENGLLNEKKIIGIQMGANKASKTWPVSNFSKLAMLIHENDPGFQFVLLGTEEEKSLGIRFIMESKIQAVNLIGKTDIQILSGVLKNIDLLISNDTGPIHIASSVGTKVILLSFGAVYFAETSPYSENNLIIQSDRDCAPCRESCIDLNCMPDISPEAVFDLFLYYFKEINFPGHKHPDISVYKSFFSKNQTLNYFPLSQSPKSFYKYALVERMLWEKALNLEINDDFLNQLFLLIPSFKEETVNYSKKLFEFLKLINSLYRESLKNLDSFFNEYKTSYQENPLIKMSIVIENTEKMIHKMPDTILKYFHIYEMMDSQDEDLPQAMETTIKKYRKLQEITEKQIFVLNNFFLKL